MTAKLNNLLLESAGANNISIEYLALVKSGTIMVDDGALKVYLICFACTFGLLSLCYVFWWYIFSKCIHLERYHYKTDDRERYMYL